jgi:hypothetical protein
MAGELSFSVEARFADSRPVRDVKYDVERRVARLLPRDPERPDALLFRGTSTSVTTDGTTTIELRLEAVFDTYNLYALRLDYVGGNEKSWQDNMRRTMDRWMEGLRRSEPLTGSPERFCQVVEQTTIRERQIASQPPLLADQAAIVAVQQSILVRLRQGKSFFTAHHEGGTNIQWIRDRFVFQDYGESEDREEFTVDAAFLARLRTFYDWRSRYEWLPHSPPEVEVWRFIERELS